MAKYDKSPELKEKISILPTTPGVYMYFDSEGTVIYGTPGSFSRPSPSAAVVASSSHRSF